MLPRSGEKCRREGNERAEREKKINLKAPFKQITGNQNPCLLYQQCFKEPDMGFRLEALVLV
jgi:hypothetical protein